MQYSKQEKTKIILRAIFTTVKIAGFISVAVLAPNALQALPKLGLIKMNKRQTEIINQAKKRLLEQGYLSLDNQNRISLTKKGEEKLKTLEKSEYNLEKPKRWDGKWRVLIFDIPEHRKATREKVRNTLRSIGFKWLQDSVWVYPYDCEDLIQLLKVDFKIGKDLLYMVVEKIENDKYLKSFFGLD